MRPFQLIVRSYNYNKFIMSQSGILIFERWWFFKVTLLDIFARTPSKSRQRGWSPLLPSQKWHTLFTVSYCSTFALTFCPHRNVPRPMSLILCMQCLFSLEGPINIDTIQWTHKIYTLKLTSEFGVMPRHLLTYKGVGKFPTSPFNVPTSHAHFPVQWGALFCQKIFWEDDS